MHSAKTLLLSVCIPTYNRCELLKDTILSIAPQIENYSDCCELIISDNASEDNTEDTILKLKARYDFIRYFRNTSNLGGRQNIWKVTTYSHSKYIWLLGDDDRPTPGSIEHILEILQSEEKPEDLKLLILNSMKVNQDFTKSFISWGERFSFKTIESFRYFHVGLDLLSYFPIKELGFISALVFERESWMNSSYTNYPKKWMYAHLAPLVEIASSGSTAYSPRICVIGLPSDQSWCLDRGVFSYCFEFPYCYQLAVEHGFNRQIADKLLHKMWWRTIQQYIKMLIFSEIYKPSIKEIRQYHTQFVYFWLIILPIHYLFQFKLISYVMTRIAYFFKPNFLLPRNSIDFEA